MPTNDAQDDLASWRNPDTEVFGYFVMQTRRERAATGHPVVRVQIENLTTGEKRTFASSAELRHYLDEWGGVLTGDLRFSAPREDDR